MRRQQLLLRKRSTSRLATSRSVSLHSCDYGVSTLSPILSVNVLVCVIECLYIGKTKGKGTFGKVKQGTHDPTNEKVKSLISD